MDQLIDGVELNPLRIIDSDGGSVMHALKASEKSFSTFGEAYFSSVLQGSVKDWKRHLRMTLNLVVPIGLVRFVLFDDRKQSPTYQVFNEFILGPTRDFRRLTVRPGIWMAFQGYDAGPNILLNVADIEHDPTEVERLPISNAIIPAYHWT
jgi:dTDP-4-dehydrorhamnose 3,5-epimerase